MKTQNLVLPAASATARRSFHPVATIKAWLNRNNRFCSSMWEEQVTNLQVLIVANLTLSFIPILAFSYQNPLTAIPFVAYLGLSVYLCKKGGLA